MYENKGTVLRCNVTYGSMCMCVVCTYASIVICTHACITKASYCLCQSGLRL